VTRLGEGLLYEADGCERDLGIPSPLFSDDEGRENMRHFVKLNALEQKARRAARREGLIARKSRWRVNSSDNRGGFRIFDPKNDIPIAGFQFDLSAEDVIEYCS